MAAEVLTKLTVVLEGAGTAWEGRPSQSPATNPQGRLWYPQVSPESCHPCPAGLVPSLVTLVPRQPQGFFRGQKLRNSPTFPATQHHVVVLADCFIFTAQAVCFHVPIEPLRIVEGALCQEQLGVRTEVGGGTHTPMCPKGTSWLSPKFTRWGQELLTKGATKK